MPNNDPALVKSVISYKAQRERIKERHRKELEEELIPWKEDIGFEILKAREGGKNISDIADTIGIKNRSFIYEMLGAANAKNKGKTPSTQTTTAPANDEPYVIEYYDGGATVSFPADGEEYTVPIVDGMPDIPEEWNDHGPGRRALYKDIIKELRENGN